MPAHSTDESIGPYTLLYQLLLLVSFFYMLLLTDAAIGLVRRTSDLFKFNSNNSLLQFLVEVSHELLVI